jgi:DNA-binding response OmpR family regulator
LLRRSKTDRAKSEKSDGHVSKGVLVANDDEDVCELLCRVLQSRHELVAYRAHSSDGAIDELATHADSIDAVILDFTGGTATSFVVLDAIRRRPELGDPAVIIVATTTANRVLAFDSGVDEFLTRPFQADDFLDLVDGVLARSPDEREAYRSQQAIASRGLSNLDG